MKRTVLALCVFLVACSSKKDVPGPRVDPTLLSLIPGDAVTLSGVRLEEMQKTPIFQKVEKLPVLGFVDEFAKQTQIDPRKNLWELLYIGDGKHSAIAARAIGVLEEVPLRMISQAASRRNITVILRQSDLTHAMQRLHEEFFE